MKIYLALAALILVPTQAAANDTQRNAERYVADAMEVATLPNGEVVTRLVSRNQVTARQFWVDSVYSSRESLLVFKSNRDMTQTARSLSSEQVAITQ